MEIDEMRTEVDRDGGYTLLEVPRDAKSVNFRFNWSSCSKGLSIPVYSFSKDVSIRGERKNLSISGSVYDEFDNPVENARVVVVGGMGTSALKNVYTDRFGQYRISEVLCDPKYPTFISVYLGDTRLPLYKEPLVFSPDETSKNFKQKDIYLPSKSTIDVYGTVVVKDYYGGHPSKPAEGVMVEMGGRFSDYTDAGGNYSITRVLRNTTNYSVIGIFAEEIIPPRSINPPLKDEPLSHKTAKRTIPIPGR